MLHADRHTDTAKLSGTCLLLFVANKTKTVQSENIPIKMLRMMWPGQVAPTPVNILRIFRWSMNIMMVVMIVNGVYEQVKEDWEPWLLQRNHQQFLHLQINGPQGVINVLNSRPSYEESSLPGHVLTYNKTLGHSCKKFRSPNILFCSLSLIRSWPLCYVRKLTTQIHVQESICYWRYSE